MISKRFFGGWADFWRPFIVVAVPVILQGLVSSSLHIVDNIMVGVLGDAPLAGVAQANQVQFILRLFLFGICSGASILISQQWGNGDIPGLRATVGMTLYSTVLLGAVVFLAAVLFPEPILRIFIREEEALDYGVAYLTAVAPSYLFASATIAISQANKATEKAVLPMVAAIISIATNTFLNWCLIYGNLGFPRLGVRGAAIATSIAAGVETLLLVFFTWKLRYPAAATLRQMRPNRKAFRAFYKLTTPVILNEGLWGVGTAIYAIVYGIMGTTTVAAMAIFGVVDQLVWAAGWGFMTGTAVLVGKRLGAGDMDGARLMAKRMLVLALITGVVLGMGMLLPLAERVTELFTASAQARGMAAQALKVFGVLLFAKIFNATNIVGVLRSGGDAKYAMWLDVAGIYGIGIPMAFLGGVVLDLPLHWVYLMLQSEEVIKAIIGGIRYLSGKWVKRLVSDDDVVPADKNEDIAQTAGSRA